MKDSVKEDFRGVNSEVVAEAIFKVMPKDTGFVLLMFDFYNINGYMGYISNVDKEDMIRAINELLENLKKDSNSQIIKN